MREKVLDVRGKKVSSRKRSLLSARGQFKGKTERNGQWNPIESHSLSSLRAIVRRGLWKERKKRAKGNAEQKCLAWHEPLIVNQASSSLSLSLSLDKRGSRLRVSKHSQSYDGFAFGLGLLRRVSSISRTIVPCCCCCCLCAHAYMNIKVGVWRVARWAYWNLSH